MAKAKEYYALYVKTFISLLLSPGWMGGIALILGFFVGTGYYWIEKGWDVMIEQAINAFVYSLAFPGAIAIVFAIIQLIKTPVIIYRNLKAEANKRTFNDVEITPFPFPEGTGFGVGLQIVSDKTPQSNFYIDGFAGKIIKIVQNGETRYQGSFQGKVNIELPLVYRRGEMFSKENKTDIANRSYSKNFGSILLVANCNKDQAIIEKKDEYQDITVIVDKDNACWITIEMKAKVGDFLDIEGCSVTCQLAYDKNKKRFLLSNLVRTPEYER